MKKIIAAAAGLMMVGVMASSASAVESKFGGYWRTRMFTQIDFNGESGTKAVTDTRTRLYYTAIFNENFKFVNKFEFNSTWGDNVGGDIGTDGMGIFRIKNSYIDVGLGNTRWTVGKQGAVIARGFIFDDDFAGAIGYINAGNVTVPLAWIKVDEKFASGNTYERDYYATMPVIKISDGVTLNPYFLFDKAPGEDWNNYYLGIDFDVKTDAFGGWGSFIYQFGEIMGRDTSAFLVAGGFSAGPVYGQAFFATGQDAGDADRTAFTNPTGASYYWAEIMGLGTFDSGTSAGSPGNQITNIYALNVGAKVKPSDRISISGDIWYASLVEDNMYGETDLGIEFDAKMTYKVMDNLNLDLIAAYLLAGDATAGGVADPVEIGARLSLSF